MKKVWRTDWTFHRATWLQLKSFWKCCLQNGSHSVWASKCSLEVTKVTWAWQVEIHIINELPSWLILRVSGHEWDSKEYCILTGSMYSCLIHDSYHQFPWHCDVSQPQYQVNWPLAIMAHWKQEIVNLTTFVVTCGTVSCHNDKLQCHQWWQSCQIDDLLFSLWASGNKYIYKSDNYRKVSNIRRTLVGNKIVDHSDVVGASPVGAAARRYDNIISVGIWWVLY